MYVSIHTKYKCYSSFRATGLQNFIARFNKITPNKYKACQGWLCTYGAPSFIEPITWQLPNQSFALCIRHAKKQRGVLIV